MRETGLMCLFDLFGGSGLLKTQDDLSLVYVSVPVQFLDYANNFV